MERRQLVALMLTDMVGYSRLSQRDEARALRLLEVHDAAIRDSVQAHGGRAIKGTGDGFLVEFPSALQAMSCAIDIQRRFDDRNRKVEEADRFAVRIGLHLGDVVRRDEDVFGDGVNITARLEPLAGSGGICVSAALRDQVYNKIGHPLVSLGLQRLKNLEVPIEAFRVVLPWTSEEAVGSVPSERTRLAVLPLSNVSPDPDDEYIADGMTEELTYALSKMPGLRVIAQTSAMSYRGTSKTAREIGRDLAVGALLEGSVRKAKDRLRITVQLIDAASEEHLWSGRYDREMADVFEIQTEIAQSVAAELRGVLVHGPASAPTDSVDAYKEYLKGRQFWARRTKSDLYRALEHFEAAVAADPNFAKAHSGIADTYTVLANHGYEAASSAHPKARAAAERALYLDPDLAEAHASLGICHLESSHDVARAEAELRRAVELNPNYATGYHWLGLVANFSGRDAEARAAMEHALELDPLAHILHVAYGEMLLEAGAAEQAKVHFLRARDLDPDYPNVAAELAWAEMVLWNWCGAEDAFKIGLNHNPNNVDALGAQMQLLLVLGDADGARRALETAERVDPESPRVWTRRALFEHATGNTARAIDWFARVAEVRPEDPFTAIRLASCCLHLQRSAEARRWIGVLEAGTAGAYAKLRSFRQTLLGQLDALEGRVAEVEQALAAVRADASNLRRHGNAAFILTAAGRTDEALDELELALTVHDPWLAELPVEPAFERLRTHPRFQQILEVMGLGSGVPAC